MLEDRLAKLRELLAQPIEREADVAYTLLEIRKVIDLLPNRFTILKFFCDWIAHPKMDRRAAKEILKSFDSYLATVLLNPHAALKMMNTVSPLISLRGFQHDLFVF